MSAAPVPSTRVADIEMPGARPGAPSRPVLAAILVLLSALLFSGTGGAAREDADPDNAGPGAARPAADPGRLCLDAAFRAAQRHRVPPQIMQAITLVETREPKRRKGPWPWTLNIQGKGYWLESRAAALARAEQAFAAGRRSVDLGCFQINYHWHGKHFPGPDAMLDPEISADYAARFLSELHAETGDWIRAAGHYHSRRPVHASRYAGLVLRTLARLGRAEQPVRSTRSVPDRAPAPRVNASGASESGAGDPPALLPGIATGAVHSVPRGAAPGAVTLKMFDRPVRPLLAAPGPRP